MSNSSRLLRGSAAPLAPGALTLIVLLAWGASAPVLARPSDALHVYGAVGYFHDDNLFRIAEDRPAFDNKRSDSARLGVAGLVFDKTYSRQRVQLQGKVSKVKFSHFKQLDYDGKDYLGQLGWQLGNHLQGNLGASYFQTLAPYTDFLSRERNLRVQKRQFFDGAWRLHPSWRIRTAATRDKFTYELRVQRFNDRTENAVELGFDYLPRSGSTAGLVARQVKGKYLNQRLVFGNLMDDSYTQDELKARVYWRMTGISSLTVLAGHARRNHAQSGPRDVKGFNGRATLNLHPRAKLRVNAALWREFSPIESNIVTFSLNRGASAGATWDATAKIRVDGSVSAERRSYEGRLLMNSPVDLKDTVRQAQLGATWSLRPAILLNANYAHQRRRGAEFLGNGSYKANTVAVNLSAQF